MALRENRVAELPASLYINIGGETPLGGILHFADPRAKLETKT